MNYVLVFCTYDEGKGFMNNSMSMCVFSVFSFVFGPEKGKTNLKQVKFHLEGNLTEERH